VRAFVVLMPHLNRSYLILNELTLFYFDLSAPKTSKIGKIQTWTDQVAQANLNKKSNLKVAPSTATSSTVVRTDRTTASSTAVVAQRGLTTKKKAKHEPEADNVVAVATFLDEDESVERDAALASPIKGKNRLTSKVCCSSCLC
jgi:hypothetical protein